MAPLTISLLHGIAISIPFSVFVVISFTRMPRVWLHSLPQDIARLAAPKTRRETLLTRWLLLPIYLIILPGLSVTSCIYLIATHTITSFSGILVHIYCVWVIVHILDFAVIDLGAMILIDPANPPIAGTVHAKGWRDVSFHLRSLFLALPMGALFVVPAAFILWLLYF